MNDSGWHSTAGDVIRGVEQVVLTGASSGIGVETARTLAETEASLILGVCDTGKGAEALKDVATWPRQFTWFALIFATLPRLASLPAM